MKQVNRFTFVIDECKRINAKIVVRELNNLLEDIQKGHFRAIAKAITLVENNLEQAEELLLKLKPTNACHVIGITGPPGAGKSTLVNALIGAFLQENKTIAVLSVDPSSPFNQGALLGDRIRMSEYYLNPKVYIRSLASRGSLGGLNHKMVEIIDVIKSSAFDVLLIETVGVGQSEVEIAGIAETTLVVMVPEAGDEVQTMKSGIMEIADIFVVNKGDRDLADLFVKNLKSLAHQKAADWEIPVIKTVATNLSGVPDLIKAIHEHQQFFGQHAEKQISLLTEKAYQLISERKMKSISKTNLHHQIQEEVSAGSFQLYQFVEKFV